MPKLSNSVYGHRGMSLGPRSIYLPIKYDLKIHGEINDGFQNLDLERQIAIRKDCSKWLDKLAQFTLVPLLLFVRKYVYKPGEELDLSVLVPHFKPEDYSNELVEIKSIEAWIELKYDPKQLNQKAGDVINATHSSAVTFTATDTEDAHLALKELWIILIEDVKESLDKHFA